MIKVIKPLLPAMIAGVALASAIPANADPNLAGRYTQTWIQAADLQPGEVNELLVTSCGPGCLMVDNLSYDAGPLEFRFNLMSNRWESPMIFEPNSVKCQSDGHSVGVNTRWVIEASFLRGFSESERADCGTGPQPVEEAAFDLRRI